VGAIPVQRGFTFPDSSRSLRFLFLFLFIPAVAGSRATSPHLQGGQVTKMYNLAPIGFALRQNPAGSRQGKFVEDVKFVLLSGNSVSSPLRFYCPSLRHRLSRTERTNCVSSDTEHCHCSRLRLDLKNEQRANPKGTTEETSAAAGRA
jgi:hypothetical protein